MFEYSLLQVLTELGDEPLTIEEAEQIIKESDLDGDGVLDYRGEWFRP